MVRNIYQTTSTETLYKLSFNNKGNKMSDSLKLKLIEINSVPVIQYDLFGKKIKEWLSIMDACRELMIAPQNINSALKGDFVSSGGFI